MSEYGGGARVIWAMSAGDREAEAQAKKGEDGGSIDRDSRAAAALKQYWCVGLRVVELVSNTFFEKHLSLESVFLFFFCLKNECV